jgi:hypothetical protein
MPTNAEIIAQYKRERAFNETLPCGIAGCDTLRWGNNRECEVHAREKFARRSESSQRAAKTRRDRHPHLYVPQHASLFWQSWASSAVKAAVDRGVLARLDGSIACTDCGNPACQYDHRDYSRPLDVDPVCRSCNKKRGTAKWPEPKFDNPQEKTA